MRRFLLAASSLAAVSSASAASFDLAKVSPGDRAHGFRVEFVYLDHQDRPLGARFMHRATGYTLDLIQVESVPQAFTWVNTFATSDQGEPHTQEHLLLLRGKRGRTLGMRQSMSLVTHSAFTQTWRTSYFFNTAATGTDVFFDVFAEQQRAMLHPDYSDAEIRLEVRNFGVTKNADGTLRLEEKGTVYNEMVASMANGGWKQWRAFNHAVYGTRHPLGYNQGGEPSGIRTMTPKDIREFHHASHHLANMGTIAAFPRSEPVDKVLARFDRILMKDASKAGPRPADSLDKLPPPAGDPEGAIRIYEYPHSNEQQPSPMALAWPASRKLDATDQLLADLFFDNIAGDATTNLYKLFIDSRTRKMDIGARALSSSVGHWGGHPIEVSFTDVQPAKMAEEPAKQVRALVMQEIARVASFADGSAELKEFNDRIASRVAERERQLVKFIGTPPGFGARSGGSQWMDHLLLLEKSPGARKSLVMKSEFARVRELLAGGRNFWRGLLADWKVTGTTPYIVGARPSPLLIRREQAEREQRLDEETARIKARYNLSDTQEALKRYSAQVDAEFARTEEATKVVPLPFVKSPPMTMDDGLRFETARLPSGVPLVASLFDGMTGATAGIALRLDGVPREELRYLSVIAPLLTSVGVIDNGRPVSYEEARERQRREILGLAPGISTNARTGRVELVLRGSGVGLEESRRAVDWMELVLFSPDWRPENLPRIRDVVDQQLAALRNTMQRAEEAWVNDPATAYRMQRQPAWLAANSFLTRAHDALRLRWLLQDPAPGDGEAVAAFLTRLAEGGRGLDRAKLNALLQPSAAPGFEVLSTEQKAVATEALRDLELTLVDIPDGSLGSDFVYLASAIRDDFITPATEALARMESLRKRILRAGGARMFLAASPELRNALAPRIEALASRLDPSEFVPLRHGVEPVIDSRLRMREPDAAPVHLGLYAPNKQGGVIITSVPSVHYADAGDKNAQLDFLATRLYSGGGSHGVFSKTVGAGLAYSNGLRGNVYGSRVGYYAERTPDLPQTVRFVVDVVKKSPLDPKLGEYAMALTFGETRASQSYEARAEGIAADLADGQPPEQVRRFRESILELRKDPRLTDQLFSRKDRVHERMVPGYGAPVSRVADGLFFTIGPEHQLDAWERYLKSAEGPQARLYRLYGRDFWMP